jgi:hypothetical protein
MFTEKAKISLFRFFVHFIFSLIKKKLFFYSSIYKIQKKKSIFMVVKYELYEEAVVK